MHLPSMARNYSDLIEGMTDMVRLKELNDEDMGQIVEKKTEHKTEPISSLTE